MNDVDGTLRPPGNILLATDFASHSDRALDRAIHLTRQWQAALHAVHALQPKATGAIWPPEIRRQPDNDSAIAASRRRIERDLGGQVDDLTVHVTPGEPAHVILDVAERERCELIIIGAGDTPSGNAIFSTTTTQLLRRSRQPLLVVRTRPHGAYGQILVGTDFTPESRYGLETAATWFAEARLSLMHVLDIPYKSLLFDVDRESEFSRMEHEAMALFVDGARLPAAIRKRIRTHVAYGYPEIMLRDHGIAIGADLTVVGALTRGLAFHILIGSNAARIAHCVPGDILITHAAREACRGQ